MFFVILNSLLLRAKVAAQPDPSTDVNSYRDKVQYYSSLKVNVGKNKWSGGAEYLYRTRELMSGMEGAFLYASTRYKLSEHLSPEFKFRYVTSNTRDYYRYELALRLSYNYKKFTFLYRPASFYEYEHLAPSYEPGHEPTTYFRNRIQVSLHATKKFNPFFSAEIYSRITAKHTEVRRMAYLAGSQIKLNTHFNLDVYYLLQPEYNQPNPKMIHAVGTSLELNLQKKKKKKKKNDYF
jgi:hypothetical protein